MSNIRPRRTYHRPNHWRALQRYTANRPPPGIRHRYQHIRGALNSACCQSFIHKLDTGRTLFSHQQDKPQTSCAFLGQTTHPERTCLCDLFWPYHPYLPGGHSSLDCFSHPGGTICSEQRILAIPLHLHIKREPTTRTYSQKNGRSRFIYHHPNRWRALQRYTTTFSEL